MLPLSQLTSVRLGGPARSMVSCTSEDDLVATVREADMRGEPLLILAGGSNVIVADAGFPGTAVRVQTRGVERLDLGDLVLLRVQAGERWDEIVRQCVCGGLTGVECLSGIPGSVGATPIQNVGAYGQDVQETITEVRAFDRRCGRTAVLSADDCDFSYRSSMFKRMPGRWVVLEVVFALQRSPTSRPIRYAELANAVGVEIGGTAHLRHVREAVLELRRAKGMVIDPADPDSVSSGSFFLNPVLTAPEMALVEERARERLGRATRAPAFPQPDGRVKTSAAWLIERAGFRKGQGNPRGIAISTKHTLALTNRGEGTTTELLALALTIARGVHHEFGVWLQPEPVLVGFDWPPEPSPGGS